MVGYGFFIFFFNDTATTEIYTLSLHDALPIYIIARRTEKDINSHTVLDGIITTIMDCVPIDVLRSEERFSRNAETDLVCRLLLEKKKNNKKIITTPLKIIVTTL